MLVQPTSTQLSCQKYQLQNQNQSPMFKGKLGEQFLNTVGKSTAVTENDIKQALTKLGIGTMGFIAKSKVRDIIASLFKKQDDQQQRYDSQIKDLQDKITDLETDFEVKQFIQEVLHAKQEALDAKQKALDAKQEELKRQEQTLTNVKNLLTQAEIDELISSLRVLHNIPEPDIKTYNSYAEQCVAVVDIINKSRQKNNNIPGVSVENINDTTITRLIKALQNDDKKISAETLDILRKITIMHSYSIPDITVAMSILKNPFGDIDVNKSASFIALYSLNGIDIRSVCNNIIKEFNILPDSEYTLSDAKKALNFSYTPYELNGEDITITEDYPDDTIKDFIKLFNINENEMLKYVTCFQKNLNLYGNTRVTSLPNLKHIRGNTYLDYSAIPEIERDRIRRCRT